MTRLPLPFLILAFTCLWVLCTSLVAWAKFRSDKRRARKGLQRIPEEKLLHIAMIGGWPGAKIAQRQFRHKTRKEPFRSQLNLTLLPVLAILAFAGLLAFAGAGKEIETSGLAALFDGAEDLAAGLWPQPEAPAPMPRRFGPGS